MIRKQKSPGIVVSSKDHDRLVDLAASMIDREPGAVELLEELSRAKVVTQLPHDAVGMNDVVTFAYDGSPYRAFKLVFPYEADIARGRISVLTLVGAMLLGLSEGQTMDWVGADGRTHRLLVEKVGARPDEPQTPRPAAMEVRVGR